MFHCVAVRYRAWQQVGGRCSVSVLQRVAVCCSVLQCVAVCCSVLQCVAVCCSDYLLDHLFVLITTFIAMLVKIFKSQLFCILYSENIAACRLSRIPMCWCVGKHCCRFKFIVAGKSQLCVAIIYSKFGTSLTYTHTHTHTHTQTFENLYLLHSV